MNFIKQILPVFLYRWLKEKYGNQNDFKVFYEIFDSSVLKTYSQYNEDLFINLLFEGKNNGFFVDVGANDPVIMSNTKKFVDKGWRGINIEPNPELYEKLKENRPNDINLNIGISPESGQLTFYEMTADTLSSFNKEVALKLGKKFNAQIKSEKLIEVEPLKNIFQKYLNNDEIDFMSVDVEGYDLKVLQSNDWDKYRPKAILVEVDHVGDTVGEYLMNKDYKLVYKSPINGLYVDKNYMESAN